MDIEAYIVALIFSYIVVRAIIALFGRLTGSKKPKSSDRATTLTTRQRDVVDEIPQKPGLPRLEGKAYIVDGDSLVISRKQIRLFGVDAPELDHPHGRNAKSALFSLCKGQVITAEIVQQDVHGRSVAKCWLPDGRDLSAEMVKLGLALDWRKHSGGQYRALEVPNVRKKLWLADARQKGQMHIWTKFENQRKAQSDKSGSA